MRLFRLDHRLSCSQGVKTIAEFSAGELFFELEPFGKNMFLALTSKGVFRMWYRSFKEVNA